MRFFRENVRPPEYTSASCLAIATQVSLDIYGEIVFYFREESPFLNQDNKLMGPDDDGFGTQPGNVNAPPPANFQSAFTDAAAGAPPQAPAPMQPQMPQQPMMPEPPQPQPQPFQQQPSFQPPQPAPQPQPFMQPPQPAQQPFVPPAQPVAPAAPYPVQPPAPAAQQPSPFGTPDVQPSAPATLGADPFFAPPPTPADDLATLTQRVSAAGFDPSAYQNVNQLVDGLLSRVSQQQMQMQQMLAMQQQQPFQPNGQQQPQQPGQQPAQPQPAVPPEEEWNLDKHLSAQWNMPEYDASWEPWLQVHLQNGTLVRDTTGPYTQFKPAIGPKGNENINQYLAFSPQLAAINSYEMQRAQTAHDWFGGNFLRKVYSALEEPIRRLAREESTQGIDNRFASDHWTNVANAFEQQHGHLLYAPNGQLLPYGQQLFSVIDQLNKAPDNPELLLQIAQQLAPVPQQPYMAPQAATPQQIPGQLQPQLPQQQPPAAPFALQAPAPPQPVQQPFQQPFAQAPPQPAYPTAPPAAAQPYNPYAPQMPVAQQANLQQQQSFLEQSLAAASHQPSSITAQGGSTPGQNPGLMTENELNSLFVNRFNAAVASGQAA